MLQALEDFLRLCGFRNRIIECDDRAFDVNELLHGQIPLQGDREPVSMAENVQYIELVNSSPVPCLYNRIPALQQLAPKAAFALRKASSPARS